MRCAGCLVLLLSIAVTASAADSKSKTTDAYVPDKRPALANPPSGSSSPSTVKHTLQGVSLLSNRAGVKVYYKFRWKLQSGWTAWKSYSIEPYKVWTHHCLGANQAQIRFDRYFNDARYTGRTVELPVTIAPAARKASQVAAKKHAFYADGNVLRVYKVDVAAERQAMRVKGVVSVSNPRRNDFNAKRIPYQLRWRLADRRWGVWKKYEVPNGKRMTHWARGATGCEIRFDRIGGDGKITPKTYNLNFDTVPSWKTPTSNDARQYEFKYRNRYNVDLYRI